MQLHSLLTIPRWRIPVLQESIPAFDIEQSLAPDYTADVPCMDHKTERKYRGEAENDDLIFCACNACCSLSFIGIHDDVVLFLDI